MNVGFVEGDNTIGRKERNRGQGKEGEKTEVKKNERTQGLSCLLHSEHVPANAPAENERAKKA